MAIPVLSSFESITSLGVGTTASEVSGEIRATGNITAYYSSDSRLKENIKTIQDPIGKIKLLNGVTFDWTDDYLNKYGGEDCFFNRKSDVGLIAQEVQQVIPEIVAKRPDGYLAIKYDRIVALLIEAIKEQQKEIDLLKERLNDSSK